MRSECTGGGAPCVARCGPPDRIVPQEAERAEDAGEGDQDEEVLVVRVVLVGEQRREGRDEQRVDVDDHPHLLEREQPPLDNVPEAEGQARADEEHGDLCPTQCGDCQRCTVR